MRDDVWIRCIEPFVDIETGDRRKPGDEWRTGERRAYRLASGPLAVAISGPGEHEIVPPGDLDPWSDYAGRDLRTVDPEPPPAARRIVACLNVWNDLDALRETIGTWRPHVDHVIAVDGVYRDGPTREPASTDGTLAFLSKDPAVEVVEAPPERWESQVEKRNAYLDRLLPGDLAFVVDADEFVSGAEALRRLPPLEVGWVPYRKAIYRKPQNFPRLLAADIRPRYEGRHYWLYGSRGLVSDCQRGGAGYDHVFVPIEIDNTRGPELRTRERNAAKKIIGASQSRREALVGEDGPGGRESLRIVQVCGLDPGMVVFRLHSALNATTPHTSVMAGVSEDVYDRTYEAPRQYDLKEDRETIRSALRTADVVHCHLHYQHLDKLAVPEGPAVVIHHHGSMYRKSPEARNLRDSVRADVRLVSNPELLGYGEDLYFLPNPVPVVRYRRLRERLHEPDREFVRIGHSPSKRELKGTETFLRVVERLRRRGLPVVPVLIENRTHADCLRIKAARCDLFFDSFFLGMQCSGIEAGAMGIPVVAGDEANRAYYREHYHDVPYVYANDEEGLERAIERLVSDPAYRERAGERVRDHVTAVHDYAAVAERYVDVLDEELDWRRRLGLGAGGSTFLTR